MRNWKNGLFPVLTALTVAALALLPLRLSTLEDVELAGTVHAEPLTADNNFPFKPPELPGRVWLLVQYHSMPEFLTIVQQEPEAEKQKELSAQARTELQKLAELGILPETSGVYNADFSASLLYLRDQRDLSSASFAMLDAYDQKAGKILSLYLDQESGHILALELFSKQLRDFPAAAETIGRTFLEDLGLEYELLEAHEDSSAGFRLADSRALCWVQRYRDFMGIILHIDLETVDSDTLTAMGLPTDSGFYNDADSMQKR